MLLPYLENNELYGLYNPKYAFDTAQNAAFIDRPVNAFICPSSPVLNTVFASNDDSDDGAPTYISYRTDYAAPSSGIDTTRMLAVGMPPIADTTGLLYSSTSSGMVSASSCTDGLSNTIAYTEDVGRPSYYRVANATTATTGGPGVLVNTSGSSGAGWADPAQDFEIGNETNVLPQCVVNCSNDNEIYGFHSGGALVVMGDGSVHFLASNASPVVVCALVTARGGEVFEMPF